MNVITTTLLFVGILSSAVADCDFQKHPRSALYGFNTAVHKNMDFEQCSTLCTQETSFTCESFDYSSATSTCFLSQESRHTQPAAFGKHAKSDYYERVCDDDESASGDDGSGDDYSVYAVGCSGEWEGFGSSCYLFKKEDRSWQDAQNTCSRLGRGGHLVAIDSEAEFRFVAERIRAHTSGSHFEIWWTSGRRSGNTWRWDLGDGNTRPMSYVKWWPGEPNNTQDREDVVNFLWQDGEWGYNDGYNMDKIRYVCEKASYN